MKVQDVMLQAMAKKIITWWQAAEILGISDRHMRRCRERYEEEGYNGLLDRRRGKPSRRRVPLATVEKVFALYRERYFDLSVQHFHEKLEAEHGIELSYTWVKQALQGAGLGAEARSGSAECIANGGSGGPCRGCCCTSMAAVTSGYRTSLFFDVTAKKAAASWCTCLPLHFGHLILSFSYSARVRMTSNGFLQSSQ